jgi:hypothetical protein
MQSSAPFGFSRIPRRVAARLERGADAAGRERRCVRLALNQLGALELRDRRPVALGLEERVVLLRRQAGQRLEHVGEVRRTLLERPLLHRLGDLVGELGVQGLPRFQNALQLAIGVTREPILLDLLREHVGAERVRLVLAEIERPECFAVRAPLGCGDVLLTDPRHLYLRAS